MANRSVGRFERRILKIGTSNTERETSVPDGDGIRSERILPTPVPVTARGQKYNAPVGRHSQQTHRRAEERAKDVPDAP